MLYKEQCAQAVQARNVVQEENQRLKQLLLAHGIALPDGIQLITTHNNGAYPGSSATSDGDYASPSSYHASSSEYGSHQHGPGSAVSGNTNGSSHARKPQALPDQVMQGHPAEDQTGIDFVLASVPPSYRGETQSPSATSHSLRSTPNRLTP